MVEAENVVEEINYVKKMYFFIKGDKRIGRKSHHQNISSS